MHLKGANSMAVSRFRFRKALFGTGQAVSLPCANGLKKQSSHLVGPPFSKVFHGLHWWLHLAERNEAVER